VAFEATVTVQITAPESLRAWVVDTFVAGRPPEAGKLSARQADAIDGVVRAHYAAEASGRAETCGSSAAGPTCAGIGASVYGDDELDGLPDGLAQASIGCANPVAVAELTEGETVLDLGSGGGIDVLLSARRVGSTGKAYGIDMTDEMLEGARANQARAGFDNVEFLRGRIEALPLPDESVDVVVSNCVIALSTDKRAVFAEAFRVTRPGGRLAIADVVADDGRSLEVDPDIADWVSCVTGALTRAEYREALGNAGFAEVSIEDSHRVNDGLTSVIVRANKAPTPPTASMAEPTP
jgi:SAM-dependent methyltransferase